MATNLIGAGLTQMGRGLRRGNQRLVYTGAALVALGLWRRSRRRGPRLVHRQELREGRAVAIHFGQPGGIPVRLERPES